MENDSVVMCTLDMDLGGLEIKAAGAPVGPAQSLAQFVRGTVTSICFTFCFKLGFGSFQSRTPTGNVVSADESASEKLLSDEIEVLLDSSTAIVSP